MHLMCTMRQTHLYNNSINNLASAPDLEPSVIPYQANQSVDPQLWDGNFSLVSLFSTDEFLTDDARNIACSLQRKTSRQQN